MTATTLAAQSPNDVSIRAVGLTREALDVTAPARVLATLLDYAGLGARASQAADRLLAHFGSLGAVLRADPADLMKAANLPLAAIVAIGAALAVHRAALTEPFAKRQRIDSHEALKAFLEAELRHRQEEVVLALFLDNDYGLISVEMVATGSVNRCPVTIRHIVERTLSHKASALILAHNHPSGRIDPSALDIATTRELQTTLGSLDVELVEHVIVGDGAYSILAQQEIV